MAREPRRDRPRDRRAKSNVRLVEDEHRANLRELAATAADRDRAVAQLRDARDETERQRRRAADAEGDAADLRAQLCDADVSFRDAIRAAATRAAEAARRARDERVEAKVKEAEARFARDATPRGREERSRRDVRRDVRLDAQSLDAEDGGVVAGWAPADGFERDAEDPKDPKNKNAARGGEDENEDVPSPRTHPLGTPRRPRGPLAADLGVDLRARLYAAEEDWKRAYLEALDALDATERELAVTGDALRAAERRARDAEETLAKKALADEEADEKSRAPRKRKRARSRRRRASRGKSAARKKRRSRTSPRGWRTRSEGRRTRSEGRRTRSGGAADAAAAAPTRAAAAILPEEEEEEGRSGGDERETRRVKRRTGRAFANRRE